MSIVLIIFSYIHQTTNSTVFATAPRESVRRSCLKEIASNDTLKNVTKNGENIADKILSIVLGNAVVTGFVIKVQFNSACSICYQTEDISILVKCLKHLNVSKFIKV